MTGQKSCQVGTTSVWQGGSRAKLAPLQYDGAEVVSSWYDFSMTGQKSCLIGTISTYEVVPNWHDLPKFIIFFNRSHFGKKKTMIKKPVLLLSFFFYFLVLYNFYWMQTIFTILSVCKHNQIMSEWFIWCCASITNWE